MQSLLRQKKKRRNAHWPSPFWNIYVQVSHSTETQHMTALRTSSRLIEAAGLYSHPHSRSKLLESPELPVQVYRSLHVQKKYWPDTAAHTEQQHLLLQRGYLLCCPSPRPWYRRDFALTYRQVMAVLLGSCSRLSFQALSKHFCLNFEAPIWWAPYEFHLLWLYFVNAYILVISLARIGHEAFQRGQSHPRALQGFVCKNERNSSYNEQWPHCYWKLKKYTAG